MTETMPTARAAIEIDVTKVIRLRSMLQVLRYEVRDIDTDQASLARLASIHNEIESQLAIAIPDLGAELAEFSSCCQDNPNPSKPEIRVAQAQVMGWIEGLLQGVQFSMANAERPTPPPAVAPAEPRSDQRSYNPNSYL